MRENTHLQLVLQLDDAPSKQNIFIEKNSYE